MFLLFVLLVAGVLQIKAFAGEIKIKLPHFGPTQTLGICNVKYVYA